jgi:hypothetical protein
VSTTERLSWQERRDRQRDMYSFEGRGGIRIPRFQFDPSLIDPAVNVLHFFRALWSANGFKALHKSPYGHGPVGVGPTATKAGFLLEGYYRGMSDTDVGTRQIYLEKHLNLREHLHNLPETKANKKKLAAIRKDIAETLANIPDVNGVQGVEQHTLSVLPDTFGKPAPRLRVSHAYHLKEERDHYRLPRLRGERLPAYAYMGQTEATFLWLEGSLADSNNLDTDVYRKTIARAIDETVEFLS